MLKDYILIFVHNLDFNPLNLGKGGGVVDVHPPFILAAFGRVQEGCFFLTISSVLPKDCQFTRNFHSFENSKSIF